jgi:hypothetical protein
MIRWILISFLLVSVASWSTHAANEEKATMIKCELSCSYDREWRCKAVITNMSSAELILDGRMLVPALAVQIYDGERQLVPKLPPPTPRPFRESDAIRVQPKGHYEIEFNPARLTTHGTEGKTIQFCYYGPREDAPENLLRLRCDSEPIALSLTAPESSKPSDPKRP